MSSLFMGERSLNGCPNNGIKRKKHTWIMLITYIYKFSGYWKVRNGKEKKKYSGILCWNITGCAKKDQGNDDSYCYHFDVISLAG